MHPRDYYRKSGQFYEEKRQSKSYRSCTSLSRRPERSIAETPLDARASQREEGAQQRQEKLYFSLPDSKKALGMETCQHIQLGFHMKDRMLIRSYTPTNPVLANQEDGTFELVVKTYFPTDDRPGGVMSNILDLLPKGEEVEVRGPTGEIEYQGNGKFVIEGKELYFSRVTLILGGSGITPGYHLIARVLETVGDDTKLAVVDANKNEADILLRDEMRKFQEKHKEQFKIEHVLSHPSKQWNGKRGHVNADIIRKVGVESKNGSVALLCGPPAMIQKAALPALRDWGYEEEKNCFGG